MYLFVGVGCMVTNYWKGSMSKVDKCIFVCIHWFRNYCISCQSFTIDTHPIVEKLRERGWFPRRCAVEIYENGDVNTNASEAAGEQELSKKKENWSQRIFWYSEHRNANVNFTQNHVNKKQVVTVRPKCLTIIVDFDHTCRAAHHGGLHVTGIFQGLG